MTHYHVYVDDHYYGKDDNQTSQELRMLSSVTINCQVTKIVMNSCLNCLYCNQCLKCHNIAKFFLVRSGHLITLNKCHKGQKSLESHRSLYVKSKSPPVPGGYLVVPGGYLSVLKISNSQKVSLLYLSLSLSLSFCRSGHVSSSLWSDIWEVWSQLDCFLCHN